MKMRNFFISEVETLTEKIPVDIKWGEFFGHDSGFCIRLSEKYFMSVFLDRRLTLEGDSEKFLLVQKPEQVIARCVSCVGEIWEVRAEPIAPGQLGVVIYTSKGKALASGMVDMEENSMRFSVNTLYPGMTNAIKLDYGVEGKVTTKPGGPPEYSVTVKASVSDSRF